MLLTIAGSETTRNVVSQGLVALLDHPEQLERLRRDPGAMSLAVEEVLRWSSPVSYFAVASHTGHSRLAACRSPQAIE